MSKNLIVFLVIVFSIGTAQATPPEQENKCAGASAFETAKIIFHKTPTNHAEASVIAYSTEKGRTFGKESFDKCVKSALSQ